MGILGAIEVIFGSYEKCNVNGNLKGIIMGSNLGGISGKCMGTHGES